MRGRMGRRWGAATAQRWAMTAVLAVASGMSANNSVIIGPLFSHASEDEVTRSALSTKAELAMHSKASCAAWKLGSA